MRRRPLPKGHSFTIAQDSGSRSERYHDAALDEEMSSGEPVLASGWWIVPCALGGLVECYLIIQWVIAHL